MCAYLNPVCLSGNGMETGIVKGMKSFSTLVIELSEEGYHRINLPVGRAVVNMPKHKIIPMHNFIFGFTKV